MANVLEKESLRNDYSQVKSTVLNFIVPLICLGLSGVLFFVLIYPSIKKIPELNTKIEASNLLSDQLGQKLKNLKRLIDFQSALTENANLVSDVLVSESQVPQLFTQIDQIAKEAGLTVTRLSYSISTGGIPVPATTAGTVGTVTNAVPEAPAAPTFKTVMVTAGVSGNYDQYITFIENLENSARVVNVMNFRYLVNNEKDRNMLDFSTSLESPYMFVQSSAVTDDPVNLDIAGKDFTSLISKIKTLRIYRPSIEDTNKFVNVQETKETTPSAQP